MKETIMMNLTQWGFKMLMLKNYLLFASMFSSDFSFNLIIIYVSLIIQNEKFKKRQKFIQEIFQSAW